MNETLVELGEIGLIPVIKIQNAEVAVDLGAALLEGGLRCAEITFRTAAAESAIERIATSLPDLLVGAGTVLSVEQAERALGAGARFIVSPGFDPAVVDWCLERDLAVTPGIATPSEIIMGINRGLEVLKFFPASTLGGPAALKAISAAFGGLKYIPTGGISAENLPEYARLPVVHACGGSWMVKDTLIGAGRFDEISGLAREGKEIVDRVRRERSAKNG